MTALVKNFIRESFIYDLFLAYGLREAHHLNDLAVERCYRSKPFESDEERLEYFFKLYEQMIEEEQTRGTLFEAAPKIKKGKK